jgi:methionyl-tRNA synthetase
MTAKKVLITSALPYVNNILHIGHLVGSQLPSDVYARFCRAKGDDVLFVCGADEHGTASEIGALKENMPVEEYVDKYRALHEQAVRDFNLSFDLYGRTHTKLQEKLVQSLFARLDEQDLVEERTMVQPYSVDDKMFLADRFIKGTCPKCGWEKADGDQCEKCGSLLEPRDLINPYSSISGSKNIEWRETKHLYFRASTLAPRLREWLGTRKGWPKTATAIANKWLDEGLRDTPITRDLKWGIPVNKPGYEGKVFYVWFDAPWGYVSISQAAKPIAPEQGEGGWADWWKNPDCHYAQFMGKDNVAFHAVFFPEQELAMNDNWKTVDVLKAMNFLNFEGAKISKSTGNGIFLNQAIEDAPADTWRYALLASAPETDDTDFTIQRFADVVNKDLNGMLGNFVSRVCKLSEKYFANSVPNRISGQSPTAALEQDLEQKINAELNNLTVALNDCEFRKAVAALREIWAAGNEYMAAAEPWAVIKSSPESAAHILNECFQLIDFYARVSAPFIPTAAEKMQAIFTGSESRAGREAVGGWPENYERRVPDGESFVVPENLFERIDGDKIKAMTEKYAA